MGEGEKLRSLKTTVILGDAHSPWVNYFIRKHAGMASLHHVSLPGVHSKPCSQRLVCRMQDTKTEFRPCLRPIKPVVYFSTPPANHNSVHSVNVAIIPQPKQRATITRKEKSIDVEDNKKDVFFVFVVHDYRPFCIFRHDDQRKLSQLIVIRRNGIIIQINLRKDSDVCIVIVTHNSAPLKIHFSFFKEYPCLSVPSRFELLTARDHVNSCLRSGRDDLA